MSDIVPFFCVCSEQPLEQLSHFLHHPPNPVPTPHHHTTPHPQAAAGIRPRRGVGWSVVGKNVVGKGCGVTFLIFEMMFGKKRDPNCHHVTHHGSCLHNRQGVDTQAILHALYNVARCRNTEETHHGSFENFWPARSQVLPGTRLSKFGFSRLPVPISNFKKVLFENIFRNW